MQVNRVRFLRPLVGAYVLLSGWGSFPEAARVSAMDEENQTAKNCTRTYTVPPEVDLYTLARQTRSLTKNMKQGRPNDPFLIQMASVASRVYDFASPVAGWKLALALDYGEDTCKPYRQHVGIYRRWSSNASDWLCALSFAGSTDAADLGTNYDLHTGMWCGISAVHNGFARRLDDFIHAGSRFDDFKSFLASGKTCGGGVVTTGHSLGGALATLMAACANRQGWWTVDGVFTFGAPGMTLQQQVTNPLSKDGCFNGYRVYNSDRWLMDPFPATGSPFGFQQPKIQEIRVKSLWSTEYVYKSHACDSDHARFFPRARDKVWWTGGGLFTMHSAEIYINRLLKLYGIYRGEKYKRLQSETPSTPVKIDSDNTSLSINFNGDNTIRPRPEGIASPGKE